MSFERELERALSAILGQMEPVSLRPPAGPPLDGALYLSRDEKDNALWRSHIEPHLRTARTFEIHCWNDETDWIALAEQFGTRMPDHWKHGVVIGGPVTPAFADMLLELPKLDDIEIYNKMTPFFNVFLDHTFQSCHYGTELYFIETP